MTEPITVTVCSGCGSKVNDEETNFCPNCGEEDPWETTEKYDFEDLEFPIVFSEYLRSDDWEPWFEFTEQAFDARLKGEYIANGPPDSFPRLRMYEVELWFKVDEDYELHGPFLDEREARKA